MFAKNRLNKNVSDIKKKYKESIQLTSKESLIGRYSLLKSSGVDEYLSLNIVKDNSKDMFFAYVTNEDDLRIIAKLLPDRQVVKSIVLFLESKDYYINNIIYDPLDLADKLY